MSATVIRPRTITVPTLRLLAWHTRTMRLNGHKVPSSFPAPGWHSRYDVIIAGRRFTLWSSMSASSAVITIDGRVRFINRESTFHTTSCAWEALTGIRFLGYNERYGTTYGHPLPVEVVQQADGGENLSNYTSPILVTDEALMQPDRHSHDTFGADMIPASGDPVALIGNLVHFVCRDPRLAPVFNRSGVLCGTVVGTRHGKAVVRFDMPAMGDFSPATVERERDLRHLYLYSDASHLGV